MSKILIVEDNEMNRDMLSRRLERKGFEVVMAEDGAKGVDMSKSENPDTYFFKGPVGLLGPRGSSSGL